ncbi:GtrA family protein [Alsobacter sp. R-9]
MTGPAVARLARVVVVGASATVAYAVMAHALVSAMNVPAPLASFASYVTASVGSYWGHRLFSFRSRARHSHQAPRFAGLAALGYGLSIAVPLAAEAWLGFTPAHAVLATAVVVPLVNLVGLFGFVFRSKTPSPG